MSETPTPAALRALEAAATPEKPLFADVDWAADRGRGVAQLIGGGGTLLAEFDADRFATFLDMAADTCDFLGGSEPGASRADFADDAAMRAAIEKAHDHVSDLCEGKTKWTMRIPAEPDRDSDLVIGAGLQAGEKALDRLAAAEQERDDATDSALSYAQILTDRTAERDRLRAEVDALQGQVADAEGDLRNTEQALAEVREQLNAVSQLRIWRNEDGKGFIFAGDLVRALRPDLADKPVPEGNAPTGELFLTTYAEHLGVSPAASELRALRDTESLESVRLRAERDAARASVADLEQANANLIKNAEVLADEVVHAHAAVADLEQAQTTARAALEAARPVLVYVSHGRRYVGVEYPYPDGRARTALAQVDAALAAPAGDGAAETGAPTCEHGRDVRCWSCVDDGDLIVTERAVEARAVEARAVDATTADVGEGEVSGRG